MKEGGRRGRTLLALDVDGVLLSAGRSGRGPWQVAFSERYGVDATRLDETLFSSSWADVIVGRRSVESALAHALAVLGWEMSVEATLECWFDEDFVPDDAVVAAAVGWAAAGVPLALVSNQEPRRARDLEQRLTDLLPISGTAFSGDLGVVKQDPAFYPLAERHLGVAGRGISVVFLDDTAANIDTARRHGWAAVHFTDGADWRTDVGAALAGMPENSEPA